MDLSTQSCDDKANISRVVLLHDSDFDAWLSAVFACYELKHTHKATLTYRHHYIPSLLDDVIDIHTDHEKAERVLLKLHDRLGKNGVGILIRANLSELKDAPSTMFGMVKYALDYPKRAVLSDYGHPSVLRLSQILKSVSRERHRMTAFVRFEHTLDGVYFAKINPDFNVLPLIAPHFKARYQDQDFAIYDIKRGYGILSRQEQQEYQTIVGIDDAILNDSSQAWSSDEARYQQFWQGYFYNAAIKERINPKLHKQYLPVRYWQYLSEKQVRGDEAFLQKRR